MTSYKDIEKLARYKTDHKVKCECGHSMFLIRDSVICSWCGRKVYKDDRTKFRYELTKRLKKKRDENNGI